MIKDKRVGVIHSDLYSNSVYSDNDNRNNNIDENDNRNNNIGENDKINNDINTMSENYKNNESIVNTKCNDKDYIDSFQTDYYDGVYCNNNNIDNYSGNEGIRLSNITNITNDSLSNKSRYLQCNLCKLDSYNDYLILSCCNSTFHIKCLINKYTKDVFNNGKPKRLGDNNHYEYLNENTLTQEFFDKMICIYCNNKLNYEDIFTLYSKNIMCNKKYHTQHITQLIKLQDQKMRIETEIKCLNEYIDKLDNDKTLSKIIIDKTYRLISE